MKLNEKIKSLGHFLGCQVADKNIIIQLDSIDIENCIVKSADGAYIPIEDCKLLLKPLSSLAYKDAMECARLANLPFALYKNWTVQVTDNNEIIFAWQGEYNYRNRIVFSEEKLNCAQVDYLRSQGYAIGVPPELYKLIKKDENKQ